MVYKVKRTKEFEEQLKNAPKEVQLEVEKAIKKIAKDPKGAGSMSIDGEASPEELINWMYRTEPDVIDLVLEYLNDKGCLSSTGKILARAFWEKYIHEQT